MKPSLSLLARLWLSEPDSATLAQVGEMKGFGEIPADPAELACAYSELFLMNMFPYATVWTDPSGELNGSSAAMLASRFDAAGFAPKELFEVAAPDHIGICLAFLDHLAQSGGDSAAFAAELLEWVPILAIAVCRESRAHSFYRALAVRTLESLFTRNAPEMTRSRKHASALLSALSAAEEIGLSEVLGFLLTPARSGLFLSRARLGELAWKAELALPFASRWDVARSLFLAAGQTGRVPRLLDLLDGEVSDWEREISGLVCAHPTWHTYAVVWQSRLAAARDRLRLLSDSLDSHFEVEYEEAQGKLAPFRD